eukprot:CAMPEP_0195125286 /NCGR_PEP_ID=MMETSP0448-20130528/132727_1 /TAXON_ID=66468 /ORGANISM="Heterocapsa triquestra, Strain CCMP 448" /LENGTH=41 /DNA_ID= /DNA_START= /DNA_END= /DNA_ORIENTATION=
MSWSRTIFCSEAFSFKALRKSGGAALGHTRATPRMSRPPRT